MAGRWFIHQQAHWKRELRIWRSFQIHWRKSARSRRKLHRWAKIWAGLGPRLNSCGWWWVMVNKGVRLFNMYNVQLYIIICIYIPLHNNYCIILYIYIYIISLLGYTEVAGSMMIIPVHSRADDRSVRRSQRGGASAGYVQMASFMGMMTINQQWISGWNGVAYFETKPWFIVSFGILQIKIFKVVLFRDRSHWLMLLIATRPVGMRVARKGQLWVWRHHKNSGCQGQGCSLARVYRVHLVSKLDTPIPSHSIPLFTSIVMAILRDPLLVDLT